MDERDHTMSKLFCFGLGYSARVLAARLAATGWRVSGTSRSHDGAKRIAEAGYDAFAFDGTRSVTAISEALRDATNVLLSVPPDADGDPVLRCHGDDLATSTKVSWIGYLSTVGVYGDHQGAWIDETTPANPQSERARRRLVAEDAWRALGKRTGKRVAIFRLPGIYGPGRSTLDNLRQGTARRLVKKGQVFNRIHVEDIARVLEAAMTKDGQHEIYNVTDDEPAPAQDTVAYAAELLGVTPPPEIAFEDAELSEMARSFYSENKRIRNKRIKSDLGVTLAYPTYREGLAAISGKTR